MNPTHLATPESEPTQMSSERRSRFGFRRSGATAVQTEVKVESLESMNDEALLFGIEDDLEHYEDLWRQHDRVIAGFANDPENLEVIAEVMSSGCAPHAKTRRRANNKADEHDLELFVHVYSVAGMDMATTNTGKIAAVRAAVRAPEETEETWRTRARIIGKQKGIFANMKVTPVTEKFERKCLAFQADVEQSYRPILKHESKMLGRVEQQISSPGHALTFVETVIQNATSDSVVEKNFASLFLQEHVSAGEKSLLARCLSMIEEQPDGTHFVERFLQDKLDENEGDNLFSFFDRTLKESGIASGIEQYMAARTAEWPGFLTAEYQSFSRELVNALRLGVQMSMERGIKRNRLRPDMDSFEEVVDRLYSKLHGRPSDKKFVRPQQTAKSSKRFSINPTHVLSEDKYAEQDKSPRRVSALTRTNNGYISKDVASVEALVSDNLGSKHVGNEAFVSELTQAIERLRVEPFGSRGIRSIQRTGGIRQAAVDGKMLRVYRANPARMPGISTSRQSKELRIVFTADKNNLNILRIFTQKSDYEQFIAGL